MEEHTPEQSGLEGRKNEYILKALKLLKDGVNQEEMGNEFRKEWKEFGYQNEVIDTSLEEISKQVNELLGVRIQTKGIQPAIETSSTTVPSTASAHTTFPLKKRFPDPEQFDGTRSFYKGWRMKCQAKLRMDSFMYLSEEDRNFYIFSRTTSKASSTLIPWLESNSGKPTSLLWEFMDEEFGDRFEKTSALDKLRV